MDRIPNPLAALFATLGADAQLVEQPAWHSHFDAKGVPGTFVLWEPLARRYRVADRSRARRRYLPHATFGLDLFIGEPDALRRGWGSAALAVAAAHLLDIPGVARVQGDPAPDNPASLRCFEKAGFMRRQTITTPDGPAEGKYIVIWKRDDDGAWRLHRDIWNMNAE